MALSFTHSLLTEAYFSTDKGIPPRKNGA